MARRQPRSAATLVVLGLPPLAPVNAALPAIAGTTVEGETVKASTGTWTGSPTSFAYEWQDCNSAGASCVPIAAAGAARATSSPPRTSERRSGLRSRLQTRADRPPPPRPTRGSSKFPRRRFPSTWLCPPSKARQSKVRRWKPPQAPGLKARPPMPTSGRTATPGRLVASAPGATTSNYNTHQSGGGHTSGFGVRRPTRRLEPGELGRSRVSCTLGAGEHGCCRRSAVPPWKVRR